VSGEEPGQGNSKPEIAVRPPDSLLISVLRGEVGRIALRPRPVILLRSHVIDKRLPERRSHAQSHLPAWSAARRFGARLAVLMTGRAFMCTNLRNFSGTFGRSPNVRRRCWSGECRVLTGALTVTRKRLLREVLSKSRYCVIEGCKLPVSIPPSK